MTKKENLTRTIKRDNPKWVPYRYDGSLTLLHPAIIVKRIDGGLDDWWTNWLPTTENEGCYTDGKPVLDIKDVKNLKVPDTNFNTITEDLKNKVLKNTSVDTLLIGYDDFILFERAQFLLGTENFLMAIVSDTENVEILLTKITNYQKKLVKSMMQSGISGIRFMDDWGMQTTMFIKPKLWRELIKPKLKELYDTVKEYGGIVFQHSCGHIEEIIPDLVEIGLDVIDPCQPVANNIFGWKEKYGDKLSFMGGLDTQGVLSFGTAKQVESYTIDFVKYMSKEGGYIATPSHTINIPEENKMAMLAAIEKVNKGLI
ncbi:MAG: hypothetical protein M1479_07915 [Actinobacteria bacterium]|nr:hypothetical protein [Actinomycetota bacterium]